VNNVKALQADLHELFQWSHDGQVLSSTDKSKIICCDPNNDEASYVLGSSNPTVDEERDLGVIIDKSLKP